YQCRPTEADGGGAADPDLVVLGRDRDDSGPPQRGALRESVGVRSAAGSDQHCATEALRLPVTGSSGIPAPGAKARISYSCSDPSGWAPRTPILASGTEEKSGSSPSTCSALRRRRAAQPGPLSTH